MTLIKAIIIILLFGSLMALWRLIGKYPEFIIKLFPFMRNKIVSEYILHVFSAETSIGEEAEFIHDKLPEKNKVIKSLRFLLLTFYMLITACLFFY